ncbi:MAG: O-antigen ligase family protein, partial [Pseudomonadota bacterium]
MTDTDAKSPPGHSGVEALLLLAVFAYVVGTDLIVKDFLPAGIGPPLESALRWAPAFALMALCLLFGAPLGVISAPLVVVFVLLLAQSALRSPEPVRSGIELLREMPVYLTALVIAAGRISEMRFWRAVFAGLAVVVIGSLLTALLAPAIAYSGYEWGAHVRRLEGIAPQAVGLGFVSGLGAIIGVGLMVARLGQGAALGVLGTVALVALCLLCLIETQSRGPFIGAVVGLCAIVAVRFFGGGPAKPVVLLTLGVAFPVVLVAVYATLRLTPLDTMLGFALSFGDDRMMTLAERALIWAAARQDILANPFFGGGYRLDLQISHVFTDEDGLYPSYHSAFLGLWRDAGVFAALIA